MYSFDINGFDWISTGLQLVIAFFIFTNYRLIIRLLKLDEEYDDIEEEEEEVVIDEDA